MRSFFYSLLQSEGTRRSIGPGSLLVVLITLFVILLIANLGIGAVPISPIDVVAILLFHIGLDLGLDFTSQHDAVLWNIRLPRVLLGIMIGAALAIAGAALQGVFRNPLADPGVIGVSSGAALGAVIAIVTGFSVLGSFGLPIASFVGGLIATIIVYVTARTYGKTDVVTLVLAGVAVNATAGAVTGFFTFVADDDQLRSIVFWTLGSLGGATWEVVRTVTPLALIGIIILPLFGRSLNLMTLGDNEAAHVGVSTERVRLVVIALSALITGASVAFTGIVGFIGLVVPHIIRLSVGPDHRLLLPASSIGGAVALLASDLLARNVAIPTEVPLGVVTAIVGGPFFLWLVYVTRRSSGGW
ncbi:MAG: iron ABC transporter permease [SAR202 cluster bacterium]|nr:iron ABC transporter permease [SAR202 cluster bacterium]|tara:strand:+ start:40 stop:1113 length:1074 start_codon:yes stop_codon:yes gene_type:complete